MKIAFTYNLQTSKGEQQAEFDTPETVSFIESALKKLGHQVEMIEVSGNFASIITRLESVRPDLIFNTAEGLRGRFREAFYPALFEQLEFPYTGSDAYTCNLTLDKRLCKVVLSDLGIKTPNWFFVENKKQIKEIPSNLRYPLIAKPNFEGSSKGIDQNSIIRNIGELHEKLFRLLSSYPGGILIEEYIEGIDVVVPYLESLSKHNSGVLPACEYVFDRSKMGNREFNIYDFELKNTLSDAVSVRLMSEKSRQVTSIINDYAKKIFKEMNIRDLGRIDFRLTPQGEVYFIEINALPSLEVGSAIYLAANAVGLNSPEEVIKAVLDSAAKRHSLDRPKKIHAKEKKKITVGVAFNLKRVMPDETGNNDDEAEFDSIKTIDSLCETIKSLGYDVAKLEANIDLPQNILNNHVDVVFNIAEGIKGRNRESQVPAILELLDIPYTGSDPTTLSLTLDKGLAKQIVRNEGVKTPNFYIMATGNEKFPKDMSFPVIVKPLAEGSSKGVHSHSVIHNEADLKKTGHELIKKYKQGILVEEYLTGREFTVGILGDRRIRVLPPMEIIFTEKCEEFPVYSFKHKLDVNDEIRYEAPAKLDAALLNEINNVAKNCFRALGCKDVGRIDLRLDSQGRVNFIECNPLPGLTPDWSDLCLIAKSAGMDYKTLINEILTPALKRFKAKSKDHRASTHMEAMIKEIPVKSEHFNVELN